MKELFIRKTAGDRMAKFILASASPRRKHLLASLGIAFTVCVSDVDEDLDMPACDMVAELARRKAEYAAKRHQDAVVIGADTIVVQNGVIMGKPKNKAHAFEMLSRLQGKEHTVYTGICVIKGEQMAQKVEVTSVYMCALDENEILSYIATNEPMDKAGAYAIQGLGAKYIWRIEGCYSNVVGLPLNSLWGLLKSIKAL
jgi:septum formation protein